MQNVQENNTKKMIYGAICLALGVILPALMGNVEVLGQTFLPMHFIVMLCGFMCGPSIAGLVGIIIPVFRFMLFGFPTVYPLGLAICFELLTYGVVTGLLFAKFGNKTFKFIKNSKMSEGKKKIVSTFINIEIILIIAMIAGRIVWGACMAFFTYLLGGLFTPYMFVLAAFVEVIPGIVIQLVFLPILVIALQKAKLI